MKKNMFKTGTALFATAMMMAAVLDRDAPVPIRVLPQLLLLIPQQPPRKEALLTIPPHPETPLLTFRRLSTPAN